nr:MAG TPA: replication initiator protein [Caudoviricetes sp.]
MNVSKYKNSKFKNPYNIARSAFIQADIDLFENPFFQNVSDAEKVVYTILSHRMESIMQDEKFCDENGYFIFFKQKELAEKLGRSLISIKRIFKALEGHGLIVTQKMGMGLAQKIYLVNPHSIVGGRVNE